MAALASKVFNSGSTLVVPPGVTFMFAQGFGSGGGGGGGAGGTTGGVNNASGGGGGGAAPLGFAAFTVTPNETLTVTVGASAAGGAGGAANTHGSDGTAGNVSKVTNGSSVVVAQFAGAHRVAVLVDNPVLHKRVEDAVDGVVVGEIVFSRGVVGVVNRLAIDAVVFQ